MVLDHPEEASSSDPTYQVDDKRTGMEVNIRDLERQIRDMARNMDKKPAYKYADTEIESPFSSQVTKSTILRKFKQPRLNTYNGSGSPVNHIRTYKAQMALATNADELYCLAFPSTLKGPTV